MPEPTKVETLSKPLAFLAEELEEAWAQSKDKLDAWAAIQAVVDKFADKWEDARIIRGVCETCLDKPYFPPDAVDDGSPIDETIPCPTCHDEQQPVSIVTAEAWEAALWQMAEHGAIDGKELHAEQLMRLYRPIYEKELTAILTALLGGGVEVAKEVVTARGYLVDSTPPQAPGVTFTLPDEVWDEPRRIALLERRTG